MNLNYIECFNFFWTYKNSVYNHSETEFITIEKFF